MHLVMPQHRLLNIALSRTVKGPDLHQMPRVLACHGTTVDVLHKQAMVGSLLVLRASHRSDIAFTLIVAGARGSRARDIKARCIRGYSCGAGRCDAPHKAFRSGYQQSNLASPEYRNLQQVQVKNEEPFTCIKVCRRLLKVTCSGCRATGTSTRLCRRL